ncbi:MAG: hypothetical protein J6D31_09105 [Clostridia bacterium]|nr:hypothetical protein [Clostridia bacterium]
MDIFSRKTNFKSPKQEKINRFWKKGRGKACRRPIAALTENKSRQRQISSETTIIFLYGSIKKYYVQFFAKKVLTGLVFDDIIVNCIIIAYFLGFFALFRHAQSPIINR